MTQFVESLYRLYRDKKIDDTKLTELFVSKKINRQEYDYIVSAKNAT